MSPDVNEYYSSQVPNEKEEIISKKILEARLEVDRLRQKILESEKDSHSSISRRDYFAGIAMEHVIPKVDSLKLSPERFLEGVVLASIKIADAMIAELDKERK